MGGKPFDCECCGRYVVWRKKKGMGYLCDPCVRCFMSGQNPFKPIGLDDPLPTGKTCFYTDDTEYMAEQQRGHDQQAEMLAEAYENYKSASMELERCRKKLRGEQS